MSTHTVSAANLVALVLLLTALSLNVSRLRLRHRQTWGDGNHKDLAVAIRTHGNTLEQSLLFGLLVQAHVSVYPGYMGVLGWVCVAFLLARLCYCIGAFGRRLVLRQAAHLATLACQLGVAASLAHAVWATL